MIFNQKYAGAYELWSRLLQLDAEAFKMKVDAVVPAAQAVAVAATAAQ